MISPKEKAKELFDKYFDLYPDQDAYFIAQLAAIMAVEEILLICTQTHFIDYWSDVKKEIEQL